MSRRAWIPTTAYVGGTSIRREVVRWEWSPAGGLRVVYADGLRCRSAWRSLPEFLRAVAEGREDPIVEVNP